TRKSRTNELLAPGEYRPCTDAVEERLQEQHPPRATVSWQRLLLQHHYHQKKGCGACDPNGNQGDWRNLCHCDFDEKVRRTPQKGQQRQERQFCLQIVFDIHSCRPVLSVQNYRI